MRAVTKTWTTYTNRRKVNIDRAKVAERETKSVPVLQLPKRMQMKLPKLQSTGPTMVNILYQERLIRVDRVRKALGDENLSQRDVGLQTFDYFYKREVDG